MKIYFLHGKNRTPKDNKLVILANLAKQKGYSTKFIDDTDTKNPNIRAKRLLKNIENENKNLILVGGSMGGYSSVWVSQFVHVKGLFLLAPALYLEGYDDFNLPLKCKNITTIYGLDDEIIPEENIIKFSKQTNSPLHIISDNHALNNSDQTILSLFEIFLENLKD